MRARAFLSERRRRLAGGLLGYCEDSRWWQQMTPNERGELREKILSDIAAYHDIVLDVVKALESDDSGITNEKAIELLEQIARNQRVVLKRPLASTET